MKEKLVQEILTYHPDFPKDDLEKGIALFDVKKFQS